MLRKQLLKVIISCPFEYLFFGGRKAEGRKFSSHCDLILYTLRCYRT
ncbi:MAG: hypothetical protein F6K17_02575 [Okeania sp. SIO3C4]|nr:hypothetical protein [Okeania sp. SIO3B3]NER01593.1 hypothetical protein [Okeania sp. SIO3C4]